MTPAPAAARLGLRGCDCCVLVLQSNQVQAQAVCPRCATALHVLRPLSVQHTLAWLLTAAVLYIPANLLPVMSTYGLGVHESHTLVGGIIELWHAGSWELSLIVFIASIAVPLLKIGSLTLLAWTAHRRSHWRQRERAGLYRLVETVGHWSMLDVFVVVLLVCMVRFGVIAHVQAELGLLAFGTVVVATMLASASFDPRLIWPTDDPAHEPR